MKADPYRQCTLERTETLPGGRVMTQTMVEWVPSKLATLKRIVECNGQFWRIVHVGQESADPRSAHECKT